MPIKGLYIDAKFKQQLKKNKTSLEWGKQLESTD